MADGSSEPVGRGAPDAVWAAAPSRRASHLAEGKAEAVLTVLRARGLAVSEVVEHQVRQCTDLGRLDAWLERVVAVESAEELFG